MTMTLYAMVDEFRAILARTEDPEEDLAVVEQDLQKVAGGIKAKAGNIAYFMIELQAKQALCAAQEKRLAARRKRAEAVYNWLRNDYLPAQLRALGQDSIDTGDFTLRLTQNPHKCEIVDENLVPGRFKTVIPQPDEIKISKDAITEHFKATGEVVPGTRVTQGERVDVK